MVVQLQPDETELTGQWIKQAGRVVRDQVEERIERLLADYLRRVGDKSDFGGMGSGLCRSCRRPILGAVLPKRRHAWRRAASAFGHQH